MSTLSVGPDRILSATSFTSTSPEIPVKLRIVPNSCPDDATPVSVPTLLKRAVARAPSALAMAVKREGKWKEWTYQEYLHSVECVARGFIRLGLQKNHSVAIIGFNAPEWNLAELGAIFAGGMAAGIYTTNSPDICKFIMENSKANILVAEDSNLVSKFLPFRSELPHLKAIVQYIGRPTDPGVMSWQELMDLGWESSEELDKRLSELAVNKCCHLVYTSGTTGPPKGVMLSHDNLTYTAQRLIDIYKVGDSQDSMVSYLPLSHVAAAIGDIFLMIACASTVYFADRDALKGSLVNTLKEVRPTIFFGVPRVYEKMHEKMMEVAKMNKGTIKEVISKWAKKTGLDHNRRLIEGVNGQYNLGYNIANKVVFSKVKQALGLHGAQYFVSAAAPMNRDILEYFLSLDVPILEMYGMSECSGPHLVNVGGEHRLGTVGRSRQGLLAKLIKPEAESDLGAVVGKGDEICMRGRNVMMGYLYNEAKTKETFTQDGWLRSGDLGIMDSDGFISITGRIKELLVTAGGENIAPVEIEDTIKAELPCISNVMVVGDRKKFLSAIITLKVDIDLETQRPKHILTPVSLDWCKTVAGSDAKTSSEAAKCARVARTVQDGITKANSKATSNAQKVQKWIILPDDFSIPGGELGPTMKLKRHFVVQKYAAVIDKFYN